MNNLSLQIRDLSSTFALAIIAAITTASVSDIASLADGETREKRAPSSARASLEIVSRPRAGEPAVRRAATAKTRKTGRLARRSPAEIAAVLGKIVGLVKGTKEGLRAEQIRVKLKMEAKEMPRILKEGLATKALRSKGHKRSTVYTAA